MTENLRNLPQDDAIPARSWKDTAGRIGFSLSLGGILGLFLIGAFGPLVNGIGMRLTFLCLPGLLASACGLGGAHHRIAKWGIALGILGCLYLPTFCLAIFWRP